MRILKRLSKQAKQYLETTPFTVENIKNGEASLCIDRNGYSVHLDIIEVEPKKKKKLFRGCNTAEDFINEAVKALDKGYDNKIVKRALYSALEALKSE